MSLLIGGNDPLSAPLAKSALTNVLTKCLFGRLAVDTVSEVTTYNIVMELETDFSGLRIGIPNADSAVQAGFKCTVTTLAALEPEAYKVNINASGFWEGVQWNGVSTAPGPAQLGNERWSLVMSDLVPLASIPRTDIPGARPLIRILIEVPAGAKISRPANSTFNWGNTDSPRSMRASKQAVAAVGNPALYNNAISNPSGILIPVVQYVTYKAGSQVLIDGDSTMEGTNSYPNCLGAVQKACYDLSTPAKPIEYFNAALHGQQPGLYSLRINDLVDVVKPQLVAYSPYSINGVSAGGMTGYQKGEVYKNLTRVVDTLRNSATKPQLLLMPGLPCNVAFRDTGAGDQQRRDLNDIELLKYTGIKVAHGYDKVVTGGRTASGQDLIKDGYTNDNVHMLIAGITAQCEVVKPFIADL